MIPSRPVYRRLRAYGLDPSLAQQLTTAPISQIVLKVPWEDVGPGPSGEYVEVIDYDPAGGCFYDPVRLDDAHLLAQDGLPPSEGTPQFHQQMVYAAAMLTIDTFEHALGRRALWSPGPPPKGANRKDDSHYVGQLRIYPHALREANAYYSPAKKALLFGYFPAGQDDPGNHMPGSMVFTCLSHDIVAHETAHALLDGQHRRLNRATNPDMLAFHEAFADIVALFQHFTFSEILHHQIAQTRGDIDSQANLLGQMANQFGRSIGQRGALRSAIGNFDGAGKWVPEEPDPARLASTFDAHGRGAILVAAVFDAFLSIYNTRTQDLIRLYTGGSGILPAGAIHPDLVHRLSDEAAKAAGHVLSMCVRALDYCPPVDLTFGEYLRALITADQDLVRDDDLNYRVAFVEAFRRRGIYPHDLRTLSPENLRWRTPEEDERKPSDALGGIIELLRQHAHGHMYADSRRALFDRERDTRQALHDWIERHLKGPDGVQDARFLGIQTGRGFEVHAAHFAARTSPDGELLLQFIVQVTQELHAERFEGGCTLILDLRRQKVAYCIRKPVDSTTRRTRQKTFQNRFAGTGLRSTYFGVHGPGEAREPFALLHRMGM
jgi:hypothetical protein